MRAWLLAVPVGGVLGLVAFVACSTPSSNTCAQEGIGCADSDGGADTGADVGTGVDAAADGASCGATQEPSAAPCTVTEQFGVFVSQAGSDTSGRGTRAMPYATIGKGVSAAKAAGKRVYVCAGTYAEQVTIDAAHDGVNLYGGFSCASWSYATTNTATVAPTAAGFPRFKVTGLTVGTTPSRIWPLRVAKARRRPGIRASRFLRRALKTWSSAAW